MIYKPNTFIPALNLGNGRSYKPNYSNFSTAESPYIDTQRFPNVVEYGGNFYVIDKDGKLWGRGTEYQNNLGGQGDHPTLFTLLMTGCYQVKVAGGAIFVLQNNGELWAFGPDPYGVMGQGAPETTNGRLPLQVATDVVEISCVDAIGRLYYRDVNDDLYVSGYNFYDTIPGIANFAEQHTFLQVASNVKRIFSSRQNVFYVEKGSNNVYTSGRFAIGTASYGGANTNGWTPVVGLTDMAEIWDSASGLHLYCRQDDTGAIYHARYGSFSNIGYARFLIKIDTGGCFAVGQGTNGSLMVHGTWAGTDRTSLYFAGNGVGRCGECGKGGVLPVPHATYNQLKTLTTNRGSGTFNVTNDAYGVTGLGQVITRELQVEAISGKLWCQGQTAYTTPATGSQNIIMDTI